MSVDVIALDGGALTVVSSGLDLVSGFEGPQGPAGRDAFVGAFFSWAGQTLAGEPSLSQVMPNAGVFDPAHCRGGASAPPTADAVFTLTINGVGAGTVTFPAGSTAPTFSFSNPGYPAGAYVQVSSPATPDPTLQGPAFVLSN